MSFQQVINALQAGNATLATQLASCCCEIKGIMSEGFSTVGYALRDQTCNIEKAIASSTSQILEGQRSAEMRELNRELAALREEKQDYKFSSMLGAYISPLKQDIEAIKCKLPKTETIPVSADYVRIDRSINEPYTRCGCGFGFGGFGFPNGWNGGSLWG
jgi:hypothetical protein